MPAGLDIPARFAEITHPPAADLRARVDALVDEAWLLRFTDRARAEALAREAMALAEPDDYKAGIALALRTLGSQRYYFHSDYEGALELLGRALGLLDQAGEVRGRADVLNGVGHVYLRRGEHVQAARLLLDALEIQRSTGDAVGEGNSLSHLGHAAYLVGDYGSALEYHQGSLGIREHTGDRAGVGYSLINIGIIHGQLGEPARVQEYMLRALELLERDDPQAAAVCLANIGNAYLDQGEHGPALEYLQRAADGLRAVGHADEASCLSDLGRIHQARGDDETARALYLRSLALARDRDARIYEPEILIRLGCVEARLGEADQGLAHLHEALRIAEAQGARQQVYAAHEALSRVHEIRGEPAKALEHFRAYHHAWREVFSTETNLRVQSAMLRSEVRQSRREAEILRQKNEALSAADDEKARLLEQLRAQATELERQTREDALTGLSNRRHLDRLLDAEWERALRFGRALTVAMLDLDRFKGVNDRFSHAAGDEVLRIVARILRDHTRGVDVVARYGGEEFCVVLVETRKDEALRLCNRLRETVAAYDWSVIHPELTVTLSAGLGSIDEADTPDDLLGIADARLYTAKHAGRNRVYG
ncbi:diguanylate cyclase [Longimicrobium sp.]|uniref:diguanylate cyclase n=1 Tax=Longimicrobium sp. TaxID=2029185 RepID=UPI003B3A87BB